MLVATNQSPTNAIAIYLRRWEIECLFQSLKRRGFRFDETHMTSLERIEKLMALLSIGFCWAHKVGEWRAKHQPILFKKHWNSSRPQYNFFRYGFDFIRDLILNPFNKISHFKRCLQCAPLAKRSLFNALGFLSRAEYLYELSTRPNINLINKLYNQGNS